jgi:hypothetical protein
LKASLWVAQALLSALFISIAYQKILTPIPELTKMMPWTGQYSVIFVRITGLVDLAGGLGILLPALTRILPRLTVLAALGCSVLQLFAIMFHLSRGEASVIPLNLVLLSLSLFVLWGRRRRVPILTRAH